MVVALGTLALGVRSLTDDIDQGKAKRALAEARTIIFLLQEYREAHQQYPPGFTAEAISQVIATNYRNGVPPGISYYSDGRNYALILRTVFGASSTWTCAGIEIRNGRLVARPDALDAETVQAFEREFVGLHERRTSLPPDPLLPF